ncbi:unnamed protein product [Brassica oleracea]|uniref:Uncharacterized protein n=1 Tax=Brassica oleracea TaxID=3712 RepID=A0A3P6BT91_BRAOL|nr:unnamed protein product [Brassica oleracea]
MYEHPDLESPLLPLISSTSRVPSESSLATNQDDITEVDLRKESPSTDVATKKDDITENDLNHLASAQSHRRFHPPPSQPYINPSSQCSFFFWQANPVGDIFRHHPDFV